MILKHKRLDSISLKLLLILLSLPVIFKAQNTIPSTTVNGCLNVSGTSRIDSSLVVGDTMRSQDIVVSGNARVAGDMNVGGKLLFDAINGISYKTATSSTSPIFSFGNLTPNPSPVTLNPCIVVTPDP